MFQRTDVLPHEPNYFPEAQANLRLVDAAHDLLDALEMAQTEIRALAAFAGFGLLTEPTLAKAAAAIAKATGSAA